MAARPIEIAYMRQGLIRTWAPSRPMIGGFTANRARSSHMFTTTTARLATSESMLALLPTNKGQAWGLTEYLIY